MPVVDVRPLPTPAGTPLPDADVVLEIYDSPAELPGDAWDDVPGASPFLRSGWLTAFAAAGGPATRYLLFRSAGVGEVVGIALEQRLPTAAMTFGAVPAGLVRRVFGRELRQFGQALFSGPHGARFPDASRAVGLLAAAREALRTGRAPWLAKDLPAEVTASADWTPLRTLPDLVLDLDPRWSDFGDYLVALPSKYRRRARRARKAMVEALTVRSLSGVDLAGHADRIDALYAELLRRADYVPFRAPRGYVAALARAAGDDCVVRGFFDGERLVGFSTLLLGGGEALAHFAAVEPAYNASHQLYLNLLFDLLASAIGAGASRLHYGRTATTIKSSVGAAPVRTSSFATHDSGLRRRLLRGLNAGVLDGRDAEAPVRRPFG